MWLRTSTQEELINTSKVLYFKVVDKGEFIAIMIGIEDNKEDMCVYKARTRREAVTALTSIYTAIRNDVSCVDISLLV